MLALTRKKGQSIVINDYIEVTIIDINKDNVKLAVKAPKKIPIYRKELYLEIQKSNQEAANTNKNIISQLKNLTPPKSGNV